MLSPLRDRLASAEVVRARVAELARAGEAAVSKIGAAAGALGARKGAVPARSGPGEGGTSTRRVTRDEVVRLGQSDRAWEFVPVARQVLKASPGDAGVRFLLALNYARLRLRTPAREELGKLTGGAAADPNVAALRALLDGLEEDQIPADARTSVCRRNVEVLCSKGIDLRVAMRGWTERTRDEEWFRTGDGNVVRRRADGGEGWTRFADDRGEARGTAVPGVGAGTGGGEGAAGMPVTVEGVCPPWVFQRVVAETPRRGDGYWARVSVVQGDIDELLDGLAMADLREELMQPRVRVFVGERAGERLAEDLESRFDTQVCGPVVVTPGTRGRVGGEGGVWGVIQRTGERQAAETARLFAVVEELYKGRDKGWWGRRYDEGLEWEKAHGRSDARHEEKEHDPAQSSRVVTPRSATDPLRVLIPACRYSTFVGHSAQDLAGALERAGCRVELLIEPDDSSLLSRVGYLRRMAEFQPDLVVVINYTRTTLRGVFPAEVPVVCWVQDPMPHLFSTDVGGAHGEMDFVVGHLYPELFERFGYPRERSFGMPVAACGRKFHTGAVEKGLLERHACEIAYASHHSETPERLRRRLVEGARREPGIQRVFERLQARVREVALRPMGGFPEVDLPRLAREELEREVGKADARALALVVKQYCEPYAERVLRHETLEWAAEIAERRGWRLRIYGRGWESHPRFMRHAAGELEHGEALRASYQSAAVHLHASARTLVHQRVLECVLSGGFPLCRALLSDVQMVKDWLLAEVFVKGEPPPVCSVEHRVPGYPVADHPELMRLVGMRQGLGMPVDWAVWFGEGRRERVLEAVRATPAPGDEATDGPLMPPFLTPPDRQAYWLMGGTLDTWFTNARELEERVEAAVERPRMRQGVSAVSQGRVSGALAYDALAPRVLELVRSSFSAAGAARARA